MKNSLARSVAGNFFLVVVFIICLMSSLDFVYGIIDYQKSFVILLGIIGVVLYLFKIKAYALFLYLWIILQLVIVDKVTNGQSVTIVDFHLLANAGFHLKTQLNGVQYSLMVNLVPLVFLPFMVLLRLSTLVGEEFMLKLYRENDWLLHKLPQAVKVLDIIDFSGNRNWLVIQLSKSISFQGTDYYHALIKAKDYVDIRKRKKKQIAHFRLFNGHEKPGHDLALKEFPFIDWVIVE